MAAIVGVAALLTACGADGGSSEARPPAAETSTAATSVLEGFTGDQLCDALATASIEQALGITVEGSTGEERGRAPVMRTPYFLSRHCDYEGGLPALNTALTSAWDEEDSDQQVLEGVFTDVLDESKPVGAYEPVPDLGVVAGVGDDPLLAQAEVAGRDFGVVLRVGEERLLLTLSTTGRATLEQLQPLAEELVANLESALAR